MQPLCHVGQDALDRLQSLDLTLDDLLKSLKGAAAEARLCTELDSPGAAGYIFWTRSNRIFRELMIPKKWRFSNKNSILLCIHPSAKFAITATSATGGVGNKDKQVRTKNPKGSAFAELVETNKQLTLFDLPFTPATQADLNRIPTWLLLYRSTEEGIHFELSLPVEMHGKDVDVWQERIIIADNPLLGPEYNIQMLDQPSGEAEFNVEIEFLRDSG